MANALWNWICGPLTYPDAREPIAANWPDLQTIAPVTFVLEDVEELMESLEHVPGREDHYERVVVQVNGRTYKRAELRDIPRGAWKAANISAQRQDGGEGPTVALLANYHGYLQWAPDDPARDWVRRAALGVLADARRHVPRTRQLAAASVVVGVAVLLGGVQLVTAQESDPAKLLAGLFVAAMALGVVLIHNAYRKKMRQSGFARVDTTTTRKERADRGRDLRGRIVFGLLGFLAATLFTEVLLPLLRA